MENWRRISLEAKDFLTVCLAKAIDQAMTVQYGNNWFEAFALADSKEKSHIRITKPGQQSVRDWDLQALLKFLRFRNNYANEVLAYHGFFHALDSLATESQLRQLNDLLDRLINDFRNQIEAHHRAADIESELAGQEPQRLYGYEEAYQDMYKLAKIFAKVTDSKGIPCCRRIENLRKARKPFAWKPVAIALVVILVLASATGIGIWFSQKSQSPIYTNQYAPTLQQGALSIHPAKFYYDGQVLVMECYLVNGTDQALSQPDIYYLQISDNGREIACAAFGILQEAVIAPGESVSWVFRFPEKTISYHAETLTAPQITLLYR